MPTDTELDAIQRHCVTLYVLDPPFKELGRGGGGGGEGKKKGEKGGREKKREKRERERREGAKRGSEARRGGE